MYGLSNYVIFQQLIGHLSVKQTEQELLEESVERIRVFSDITEDELNGEIDYDAYDRNVFKSTVKR